MKTLLLKIDDSVYADLENAVRNKRLEGKFAGVIDMTALAIIESIKNNQPERTIRYKRHQNLIPAVGKS